MRKRRRLPLRRLGNAEPEFSMDAELIDDTLRAWPALTPAERLAQSWERRKKIRNLRAYHDEKLFPRP